MTTAQRLINALNDAKANLLTVAIQEQQDGDTLVTVDTGSYQDKFLVNNLERLIERLEWTIEDYRIV